MKLTDIIKIIEFIFGLSHSRFNKNKEVIGYVQYPDDNLQIKYINCLVFNKLTGLSAAINDVNIIFNCFDPLRALYIYKIASAFICIKGSKITRPNRLKSIGHYIAIAITWSMCALSL